MPIPLQIDDFSGGLTDFPVGADPTELMAAKNVSITVDQKAATRPGSLKEGTNDTACKLPGGVAAMLPNFSGTGFPYKLSNYSSAGRLYASNGTTHAEIVGPTGNSLFTSAHTLSSDPRFISAAWNAHQYLTSASFTQRPHKLYMDSLGALQLRTAGLPKPAATDLTGLTYATTGYAYAWGYKYTYTSGNRTFIDRGPLQRFKANGTTGLVSSAIVATVGGFPTLSNGASDNWDTASIKIELYRTTNNGSIYYLVGEITNGTATIADGLADTALITKQEHYTTSGQPDFDPPPICKFVHVTERGIGLYGYIQDGSDEMKNRGVQSIAGDPDSVPGSFNFDIDEEMTGISSYKGIPIIFSAKKVYRGEGQFSATSGALTPRKIEDSVGCISHTSIVQAPDGVYFAGENGFYWTDGYTVSPISDKIRKTYASVYAGEAGVGISGAYYETEKQVLWTFPETGTSDGIFVYHTRFGLQKGGCFTRWGGEVNPDSAESGVSPAALPVTINQNFRAKCLLAHNKLIYRGDDRGYAFYFDSSTKTDPRVVTSVDCSTWGTTAISYDLRLVALNFGTNFVRKWTPQAILTFKNRGDLSLTPYSDRNLEGRAKALKEIRKRSDYAWAAPGILWGDPVIYSSAQAIFEEIRTMPVPGIRCSYRSLWFKNSFTVLTKSDILGLATIDPVAKTITLNSGTWPVDALDLYVALPDSAGVYTSKFLITAQAGGVLTLSDAGNALVASSTAKWQLMGTAKGHVFELQSVVMPYILLESTQNVYRPGTEGGNS